MPNGELPAVSSLPFLLSTYSYRNLVIIAGLSGYGGYDPNQLTPEEQRWLNRVMRKAAWHALHKKRRRHHPLSAWDNFHHR
jgi:hypothetical protein